MFHAFLIPVSSADYPSTFAHKLSQFQGLRFCAQTSAVCTITCMSFKGEVSVIARRPLNMSMMMLSVKMAMVILMLMVIVMMGLGRRKVRLC